MDARSSQFEISSISLEGNETLSAADLKAQLRTRETPGFFNKFLYGSISDRLGRKNEYFSAFIFGDDIERLKKYYENRGFAEVRIDTSLTFSVTDRSVDIRINIHEGYRSIIDSLTYKGNFNDAPTIWTDILSAPKINKGDPFNRVLLEEEVKRVLLILYNTGYPNAVYLRDSSIARHYLSTKNWSVVLSFDLGKRYVWGNIAVQQDVDSLRRLPPRPDITDDIILPQLDYKPNDFYSRENRVSSERNLARIGIFDLARINVTVPPNSDTSNRVASLITVRAKDKHELAPEVLVSDENGAFNLGTGIGYSNRNFLGGARTFTTRLRFRTQTLTEFPNYFGTNSGAVSSLDLTFEMLQPYIVTNKVKGTWTFSTIIDKQKPYRQEIIRNRFGVTDRFAEFTTGYLDWTLERVRLVKNDAYLSFTSDPQTKTSLDLLAQQAQFNSILSFTIQRDMTNDIFSPSDGFSHAATIEESGLLPLLIEKKQPELPFTQFYRMSLLGRWYFDLTGHRYSIVGMKLKGGFEEKYGESASDPQRSIPQTHRFFAGGGGSVRGWNSRELIASGNPQLGGNLLFEGTFELRTNLLQSFRDGVLDKIWLVEFIDFGNVWSEVPDFRVRDIAIAAGLGFRYDTFFGPFRIDWGFRVYNPGEAPGGRWITQRRLLGQTFKEAIFHFGIGHAF